MTTLNSKAIIIIPFYHGLPFLELCLKSIRTDNSDIQILIINNDPKVESLSLSDPNLASFKTQSSIGFARAVNLGLTLAFLFGYDKYIILNQDTIFQHGSLNRLLQAFTNQDSSVYIPVLMSYDFSSVARDFKLRSMSESLTEKDLDQNSIISTRLASAACVAFGKSAIVKHGLLDPFFYMYGEDDDWFKRIQKHGDEIRVVTASRLAHMNQLEKAERPNISTWHYRAKCIIKVRNSKSPLYTLIRTFISSIYRSKSIQHVLSVLGLFLNFRTLVRDEKTHVNRRALHWILNDLPS